MERRLPPWLEWFGLLSLPTPQDLMTNLFRGLRLLHTVARPVRALCLRYLRHFPACEVLVKEVPDAPSNTMLRYGFLRTLQVHYSRMWTRMCA